MRMKVKQILNVEKIFYSDLKLIVNEIHCRLTFTKSETRDSIQEATTSLFQRGGTLNPTVSVSCRCCFHLLFSIIFYLLESYCSTTASRRIKSKIKLSKTRRRNTSN